jgi:20S proteasome subunit beta 2
LGAPPPWRGLPALLTLAGGGAAQAAIDLVRSAIQSGIDNDLGSGSNVDITVITAGNVERFRNIDKATPKYKSKNPLSYAPGTTKFWDEAITKHQIVVTEGEAMDE